jgi:Fe-S oxidoreductase
MLSAHRYRGAGEIGRRRRCDLRGWASGAPATDVASITQLLRPARNDVAMTTIYDPTHPLYSDEADVRGELTRVFDACYECRRCIDYCTSFPTLFEMIDRVSARDAGSLTPAQQDQVVDACFHCKLCAVTCPYTPDRHERAIDVPRLMLRANAMHHDNGHKSVRSRVATQVMGRTGLVGAVATTAAPLVNKVVEAEPGSLLRRLNARVTGVSATRLLPSFARQRFSAWFALRPKVKIGKKQGSVTVYPTCLVEYNDIAIGKDLVKVYERNGVECAISTAGCCGAPWLLAGDVESFTKVAKRNVKTLAAEIRRGTDVVVAQPTCGYILKRDYVTYVGGADAKLVAEHTLDATEYLMKLHRADDVVLDTEFAGDVPKTITYHVPSHLRAQTNGFASRDLMKLTGASVKLVQQSSGNEGMWGLRDGNEPIAEPLAQKLGEQIESAGGDVVTGDCHLANTAIVERTGLVAVHPLQVIARAYGIPEEV